MHLVNKYKPQKTLGELNNYIKVFTLNNFTLITKFDKGYLLKKIEVNNKTSIFLFNNLIKQYFLNILFFFLCRVSIRETYWANFVIFNKIFRHFIQVAIIICFNPFWIIIRIRTV